MIREKEAVVLSQLQEESESYKIDSYINNEHDKVFRTILGSKKEAVKFINKTLDLEIKLTEEQIEKYNSSFVTKNLKNKECDVIYKLKDKNIFFLIEHQTKIDYTMPLRILEYETEIIKSAIDEMKLGKRKYKLPKVISTVLYSGKEKWNVRDYIGKVQEKLEGYREIEVAKYNIIDVNNYTEEELLKEESLLSKVMLIEKMRNTNNLAYYLDKIADEINRKSDVYTLEQKELLINIVELALSKKLDIEETERITKKLKGEDKQMLAVLEMIEEENKKLIAKGKRIGKKEAKAEYAKKMLEENIPIETIIKITGLTKEEITS